MIHELFQSILRHKTFVAVASIILGICLIISGRDALDTVVRFAGWGLLILAVIYLISYFASKDRKDTVQLGYAVLCGLGGLLVVRFAPSIVNFFPRIAGILLIVTGFSSLIGAIRNNLPIYSKIAPALILLLGILIFFNPGVIANAVVLLIGIGLILNGLYDLELVRRLW